MSRSRKHHFGFNIRTGAIRRGFRQRGGKEDLSTQIEHEYGWDPRSSPPERMWLHAETRAPGQEPDKEDGEPTRAVRSFSLVDGEDS
jgi:hypothetical protein